MRDTYLLLGDRWGQRRMLIRIVGCWSAFTVLTGLVRNLPSLLVTRTIFGAAEAGAFPTLSRALSRWFPVQRTKPRKRDHVDGSPIRRRARASACGRAHAYVGWRYTFAIFGVVGLIWCAVFARWYRDDPAEHPAVSPAELRRSLRRCSTPPFRGAGSVEGLVIESHDDRAVLQLFRFGLRISVLRHMAADVLHARARSDAPAVRGFCGAAARGRRDRMLLGGLIADWITRLPVASPLADEP